MQPSQQSTILLFPKFLLSLVIILAFLVSGCIPLQETPQTAQDNQQSGQQNAVPLATPQETIPTDPITPETYDVEEQRAPQEYQPSDEQPQIPPSLQVQGDSFQEQIRCEDSDAGFDQTMKGTVTRTYQKETTSFEDKCNNAVLLEHYCEDGIVKTREVVCDDGCANGACLSPKSTESTQPASQEEYDPSKQFYNCYNGFRDTQETDVDCGGPDCFGCGYGRRCTVNSDCAEPLVCNVRMKKCSDFRH